MKFILISLIIVIIINVTRAKNLLDIFLEYRNLNKDVSKASRPPSYVIARRRTIGLYPSLPNRVDKFMMDLQPPRETHPVTMSEQSKQLLMRELAMKDEYKDMDKMNTELTTRRSLMPTKKFTVRPHDVHAESVREKNNWNRNRKTIKSGMGKSEGNIAITNYKTIEDVGQGKRKSKSTLLFPKENNTKHFKENPKKSGFKRVNNIVPKNKAPLNVVNDSNNDIVKEKENIINYSKFTKSDSKDQMEDKIKPKDNFFDLDELIPVKVNDISSVEPDNEEITTDSDIELVSRHKRSVNIIEEERVATTSSGFKITNQDYPIGHALTFNNIHT